MPIFVPILIGAGVLAATGYGGKKAYDGVQGFRDAKRMIDDAKARHERHVRVLDSSRERISRRLSSLQELREETARTSFGRMVEILQRISRRGSARSVEDFQRMGGATEQVQDFVGQLVDAGGLFQGGVSALGAAAVAKAATTSAVASFATASTGTAISGLSGAAANSAMLAWLGGGSLATGGFGMAGGTVVLGGVAVAPVALVGGLVVAAQGEKAREQATKYEADVAVAVAQIDTFVSVLRRADQRARELLWLTRSLAERAAGAMDRVEEIAERFDDEDPAHLERLRAALLLCSALRQIIDCRVLDDDGQLDATAEQLMTRFRDLVAPEPEVAS